MKQGVGFEMRSARAQTTKDTKFHEGKPTLHLLLE